MKTTHELALLALLDFCRESPAQVSYRGFEDSATATQESPFWISIVFGDAKYCSPWDAHHFLGSDLHSNETLSKLLLESNSQDTYASRRMGNNAAEHRLDTFFQRHDYVLDKLRPFGVRFVEGEIFG